MSESVITRVIGNSCLDELPLDYLGTTSFGDLYKNCGVIGSGSFGIVLRVIELSTNEQYAMKVIL